MTNQIEWLKARLAELQFPAVMQDHDTREKWLINCGMPPIDPDKVQRVARAIMMARGDCNVVDWRETEWNPTVAQALKDAQAAINELTDAGKVEWDYDDDVTAEAIEKLRLKAAPAMDAEDWVQIDPLPTPEASTALDEARRAVIEECVKVITDIPEPSDDSSLTPDFWSGFSDGVDAAEAAIRALISPISGIKIKNIDTLRVHSFDVGIKLQVPDEDVTTHYSDGVQLISVPEGTRVIVPKGCELDEVFHHPHSVDIDKIRKQVVKECLERVYKHIDKDIEGNVYPFIAASIRSLIKGTTIWTNGEDSITVEGGSTVVINIPGWYIVTDDL